MSNIYHKIVQIPTHSIINLVVGKGRGGMFLFLLFLHFHSCSSFFPVPLFHLLYSLSPISFLPFSGRRHKMTLKGWHVVKPQHNQSIINKDMVDNLTQTRVFTLLFPSPETFRRDVNLPFRRTNVNRKYAGLRNHITYQCERKWSCPSFTAWCRISATLLNNQTKRWYFLIGQNFLLGFVSTTRKMFLRKVSGGNLPINGTDGNIEWAEFFCRGKYFRWA